MSARTRPARLRRLGDGVDVVEGGAEVVAAGGVHLGELGFPAGELRQERDVGIQAQRDVLQRFRGLPDRRERAGALRPPRGPRARSRRSPGKRRPLRWGAPARTPGSWLRRLSRSAGSAKSDSAVAPRAPPSSSRRRWRSAAGARRRPFRLPPRNRNPSGRRGPRDRGRRRADPAAARPCTEPGSRRPSRGARAAERRDRPTRSGCGPRRSR